MTYNTLVSEYAKNFCFYENQGDHYESDPYKGGKIFANTEFVYLFYNPATSLTKIGITNSLDRRLMQIGTMAGNRLVSLLWIELWKSQDVTAKSIERILHNVFAEKRCVGEWFRLNKRDLAIIRRFFFADIEGLDIGGRAVYLRYENIQWQSKVKKRLNS